ncbi:citron Rho-interacting kinase [Eurytemora carolleeae]|uniref:citron Rho-interacting kinase n=1 Tax=Eurytemora carolleeae TaxID=1294199 RepID=UPI000C792FB6|nr:citron Rho-interacting kinase [Eurytemora carolleeae]|eukprot:XP_023331353.1 citron Rho-interacting kinase-like [Eurytemora affinis]
MSHVRAEVVALKTNTQDKNIPRSVINQIDDKMTATHNIPHRLHQGANKKSSRCPVCQDTVGFMMLAQICKDCGVSVHSGCSSDLPPTCGLSVQLVSALQGAMTPRSRANSSSRARSSSESRANKDRPLPIPPVNTNKEGEVFVLLRGDWVESVLVLTLDNILDIYQDASRNIRIDQIALTAPHCRVSVQPSVSFSEVYYVSASDRPYTFKLTVHVTGKSEKAVYLMCKNFAQKVEWVNRLEEVITSSPSNMVPIPDGCNEHCKELIAAVPADTEILAMDTVGDVVLIGTTKGLLIRDLSNEVGELRSIEGVDVPVHRIKYIKSIQSVLLATGSDGSTGSQLVMVCARAVQAGSTVHPEPVPEISHCHIFAANENSKGHVYLCAANKHQVSIFEWSPKRAGFVIRNKFSTDKYTGCIYFTEHSVLVGTTKFYEIDLKNFSAEEFLDTCDPGIKRTLKSAEFEGSEPCDVLPILIREAEPEYILCFTRHLLFVDGYGQQTREPMLFSKLPMESTLIGSVLATSFSDRIQLITFDLENTENSTTTLVEVFSAMPHLVGSEKNKLYYTTPGDAAYHLVALDVTKLKQEV